MLLFRSTYSFVRGACLRGGGVREWPVKTSTADARSSLKGFRPWLTLSQRNDAEESGEGGSGCRWSGRRGGGSDGSYDARGGSNRNGSVESTLLTALMEGTLEAMEPVIMEVMGSNDGSGIRRGGGCHNGSDGLQ